MAVKKSELYSSIWASCDELRGGMDASQYKDYILPLLFLKYVSDKYAGREDALIYIPEGASFRDLVAMRGKAEIGEAINKALAAIDEENGFNMLTKMADFNDEDNLGKGKELTDRLSKLIGIFDNPNLDFSNNRAEDDDLLGDAYEYLMMKFAQESGKSKGQFYTPAEVSRIMAKILGINEHTAQDQTAYDMACGSASLLLKIYDEAPNGLTIYGQEKDNATVALAKMNLVLHNSPTAVQDILQGDTLSSPEHKDGQDLKRFDFCVANPPFSTKSWSNGFDPNNDYYHRFDGFGIPPEKNGDYAFLLHMIKSMKSTGKAAIILPHGVLFRGNAEGRIREEIIKRGLIKGIIGLPANLFYGTGIPACIIVLDKENTANRKEIFMIDAGQGFIKDGNKNRLREQDIHKIVDVFNKGTEIEKYSRSVPMEEIAQNEYNLNIPRYIDTQEEEDIQDLKAHIYGGIPNRDIDELKNYWAVYPGMKNDIFKPLDGSLSYSALKIEKENIKDFIFEHAEFQAFKEQLESHYQNWKNEVRPALQAIDEDTRPKELVAGIAEKLLKEYQSLRLLDAYSVYQHLMDLWNEGIRDDAYMLLDEGWTVQLQPVVNKKGDPIKGEYESELIPAELVINRYFQKEQEDIRDLESRTENAAAEMEALIEEHSGEEGLLSDVVNDKGNITKGDLNARLKAIKGKAEDAEEEALLLNYKKLTEEEAEAKKAVKTAEQKLKELVLKKYNELTTEEIKTLIVDDKWLQNLKTRIDNETDQVSQRLSNRISELTERYETTLPELENDVTNLQEKVNQHLQLMINN